MKKIVFSGWLLLQQLMSVAQPLDTLHLNLETAEAALLKSNLNLVAAYYEIDAAEAELIQARLWANPNFVWNQDLYSNEQNRYFNVKNQRLVQVEQVFSIAGKHTNTVRLARISLDQNRLQAEDVLRSLLFELGQSFFALEASQQKQQLLQSTVARYDQLIASAEERLRVGAMAANEVVRLKSEQIAVRAELRQNQNDVLSHLSTVRILLNLNENVYVVASQQQMPGSEPVVLHQLIDVALSSRPDHLLKIKQVSYESQNLRLQKSLAVPDLNIAYQPHDKGSNYVRPYQGVNLEFNVPFFNRNQGSIKLAKVRITQAQAFFTLSETTVRNEVATSYEQFVNSKRGFEDYTAEFLQQTELLNTNANENYSKKNINILEFIDLQRIYIINKTQYIDLRNAYLTSVNQLNFSVGKKVIP
jgi:cobalt-zinc-cadmium efflux system outer membrane protein